MRTRVSDGMGAPVASRESSDSSVESYSYQCHRKSRQ